MSGFRPMVVGMVLVLLVALSCFMFMTSFLQANNPDSDILNDESMISARNSVNSSLNSFENTGRRAQTMFENNSNPSPIQYVFLISEAFYSIPKTFVSTVISGVGTIGPFIFTTLLGSGSGFEIVLGVVVTIIIITVIILFIKFVRTGESER